MALHELDADDRDLVSLLTTGLTSGEIAVRLRVSVNAIERRTSHLLMRLGLESRAELISATALDEI